MVVGHNVKSGVKQDVPSKRHKQRDKKNNFSVSVTSLPPSHDEFKLESELEASGTRITMEQGKEDENHNPEILDHGKFITVEETYNDDDIERTSEVDEEVSTSLADYEHLHPVTQSIFQQLATPNSTSSGNAERIRVNPPQLYMPNAIRSSRLRRMNYSPWGYDSPAHGDIINVSPGY